jgi:hemerythrin-like domain-containing protein
VVSNVKRDPRLQKLSSDHHRALVLARHAERAAGDGADAHALGEAWDHVRAGFAVELAPHFAIEESVLLPAMRRADHDALVDRTLSEHQAIRACIGDPSPADVRASLQLLARLLTDHVRFEERELFEAAQIDLPDADLDAVDQAGR